MNIEEFKDFVNKHSVNQTDFFKMTALCGEVGELANVIKKAEFYNMFETYQEKVEKEIQAGIRKTWQEQFIDEAGDVLFYYIQLLEHWNVSIEEVIEYQKNKILQQDLDCGRTFKK